MIYDIFSYEIGHYILIEKKPSSPVVFLTELSVWPLVGLWGVVGTLWAPPPPSQLDTQTVTPCRPSSSNICQKNVNLNIRYSIRKFTCSLNAAQPKLCTRIKRGMSPENEVSLGSSRGHRWRISEGETYLSRQGLTKTHLINIFPVQSQNTSHELHYISAFVFRSVEVPQKQVSHQDSGKRTIRIIH